MTRRPPALTVLASAAVALLIAPPGFAALGGNADSVSADVHILRGQVQRTGLVQYDVQQIVTGDLVVNEYVTRAGQVFAITWHGPVQPDLQQLLGSYFPRVQRAAQLAHQASPGIHRQLVLNDSDLVVQSVGRLRDFRGIAYLPALVPGGVQISQLQ